MKNRVYAYGMRLRGFSPGCQPMEGLLGNLGAFKYNGRLYHGALIYDRPLTEKEIRDYELDEIKVYELQAGRES